MAYPWHGHTPIGAFGMASLVIGVMSSLLFFLPVLGIPLGACGIACGIFGAVASFKRSALDLRWALAGLAVSSLGLGINVAIAWAPVGYLHEPSVPPLWQSVPERPTSPPPARQV